MKRKEKNQGAVSEARVLAYLRQRYNPLLTLNPETLKAQHAQFDQGYLYRFALTMEHIKETDDTLKNVSSKREKAPGIRGYEILTLEKSARADRHKAALEYFYDNLSCVSAVDLNQRGGYQLLFRQMMQAVSYKYAVHEMILQPSAAGITAEFRATPLWFFENTVGRLRFLETEGAIYGRDLEEGGWLVTVGDYLMKCASIAYLYKHMPLRDWLIYCGRNGMPGFLGKSSAAPDSAEWKAMETAVAALAAEWYGVASKDDSIDVLDLSSKGELPYPKLVERMDRAMMSLYRGGDLSTMSSGQGEGTGASVQDEEAEILEASDAAMISEALQQQVDPVVVQWATGDEHPLAYIQVKTSTKQNVTEELQIDQQLHTMGVPLTIEAILSRYNRSMPGEGESVLTPPVKIPASAPDAGSPAPVAAANASLPGSPDADEAGQLLAVARAQLSEAQQAVLKPVADRLNELYKIADREDWNPEDFTAQVRKFLDVELPDLLRQANAEPQTAKVLEELFVAAYFNGAEAAALEKAGAKGVTP